ncbi:hypothetical protein KJN74_00055 [Candidatus Bathyarchaeota archaeon]|nr:hypothetical protein [Candidatus Bathyarchaeota archaeon]
MSEVEANETPKKVRFRLFFIGNEENDVEVVEVNDLDFKSMKRRLRCGKNVFISGVN